MAFKSPFVPSKKVSFPEDSLPPKFFNDKSQGRRTRSTVKARIKGDTFTMKENIGNRCDETGKNFLEEAKILESLNHLNLVNFKNVCYEPLAIMFEYVSFSFLLFGTIREIRRLDGFPGFLDCFSVKMMKLFFFQK